jgi:hypothetical protein
MLVDRHPDNKPVEFVRDRDLAGESRSRLNSLGKIEHRLLHSRGRTDCLRPGVINIDVASRTRTGPATIGIDAGNIVPDCAFHHALADPDLYGVYLAVIFDVGDGWHAFLRHVFTQRPKTILLAAAGVRVSRGVLIFNGACVRYAAEKVNQVCSFLKPEIYQGLLRAIEGALRVEQRQVAVRAILIACLA